MSDVLHLKYRPTTLDQIIGQDAVVNALARSIEKDSCHAYLFIGPSGCGKTSLSRIMAEAVGCLPTDIEEVDAATVTGVDDMRALSASMKYKPLGGGAARAILLNECHRMSGNAWDSLLMAIEEPPAHAYWFFTTTDAAKVPKAVTTRCMRLEVQPVPTNILFDELLVPIVDAEQLTVTDDILKMCAREAQGSPRQALVNLAACSAALDTKEAATLLRSAEESGAVIDLARALIKGEPWENLNKIIGSLDPGTNSESVRHVVRAYMTKVILGASVKQKARRPLAILDAFSQPFNSSDGLSPLVLAVGKLLFHE